MTLDAAVVAPTATKGAPKPNSTPAGARPATVVAPTSTGRHPAVVLAHGFGGSKADLMERARELAGQGYVTLAYTARGFGASGGRIHLDDPDYEIADASRLLDTLAGRRLRHHRVHLVP